MVINSPCLTDKKELTIPGQTTTVDFLSTCSINYALNVSPTIYASYIEQFWNTTTSKIINSMKQIHAIVDGKAVVISESSVRSNILFNDEDGVTCLTNDEIFENLALMGYEQLSTKLTFQKGSFSPQWKFLIHTILHCISSKSTAWNEFSTNLALAVICLAKGQKFNFSKLIFDGMLRNLDSKKFLMYLRFLQLFLNNQLKDLPEPLNDTYVTPFHTKKVFSNMARKSVNFSRNITLLFAFILVQNQAPEGEGSIVHPEPQPTPSTSQPNVTEPQIASLHIEQAHQTAVSQIVFHEAHIEQILLSLTTYQRKRKTPKYRRTKKDTELPQTSMPLDHGADEAIHKEGVTGMDTGGSPRRQDTMGVLLLRLGGYTPGSDEGRMTIDELITLCTKLSKQVLDLKKEKDAQAMEILNLKKRVKKLERKRKSSISHPRRRKYRQVETSSDDDLDEEDASKQGRISDKLKPMFKDKDFEELDDHIENVEEETVDADVTRVGTVSAPVSTVGVTISTDEPRNPPTTTIIFDDEDGTMAMAQKLIKMKEQKAKEKGVAITNVEDSSRIVRPVRSITTLQPLPTIDPKDKGKGVLVEEEPVKIKIRDQAKEFDEIQARIDADHELAVRLTHEEQEKYIIEEMARLLAEFFDQRKKQLAAARAEAIRNKPPIKTQVKNRMITYLKHMAVSAVKGNEVTAVKASAGCVWRPKMTDLNNVSKDNSGSWVSKRGNPQQALKNKGIFDSGCSRHMTWNEDFLIDYQDIDGGFVAFGGSARGGKITGKGKIRTDNVLFTETECLVLSPNFKLLDASQVLLRVPRQSNMYSFDLKNVVPSGDLTCLFAKAKINESKLWHRRMGHVNFKTMNKLVKGNLVRGLPSKIFENDHTCVACQKGKQHKASYKAKLVSSISQPLQMLHMDLFGPTSVRSINHKTYCLVVTDDFSRFSWVFFLASKDKTSGILKRFITEIENQLNHKVKVIRCDNGTEFKNKEMNEFYRLKGIKGNLVLPELHNKMELLRERTRL
ncbi:putative ribonuclease H-like domain-containing protein [Tanacetum coccineum]